ncbi:MFS transporter [Patescibacteria group bacterium]|nr:MFS transporter [Patescibacteria group bacterium]MBU4481125.1 MFS transporter [Patescibacteria group bacterium]
MKNYFDLRKIFIWKEELKIFYASIFLFSFASSILQIFIPLYLFGKGFSIGLILLFFAVSQIGRLVSLPICAHLSSSLGAKKNIVLAYIFSIFYFLLLQTVKDVSLVFWLSALLLGLTHAFFWLPLLVHQSKISPNEKRGKITGRLMIYSDIASAIGPFLGGIIIAGFGFNYAFFSAILIIIPAIGLLLLTPEVSKIRKIKFRLVNVRKVYPDLIANGFFNFQAYLDFAVWPIFIFLIISRYQTIGFIQTVSLFISLSAFYLAGKWTDKFNRGKVLFLATVSNSAVGVLRPLANSLLGVFLFNTASAFTNNLQAVPWNVKLQEHLDQDARTEYMFIFEVGGAILSLLGFLTFMALTQTMFLKDVLIYGLIISALAGLGVNMVRK